MRYLCAYATMLPRLRAEESMRRVTEAQVGGGHLSEDSASDIWEAWKDAAEPGREEVVANGFFF